jgi:hypothetical protein
VFRDAETPDYIKKHRGMSSKGYVTAERINRMKGKTACTRGKNGIDFETAKAQTVRSGTAVDK